MLTICMDIMIMRRDDMLVMGRGVGWEVDEPNRKE